MAIKFDRTLEFEYGKVAHIAPGIRRIIARNPSAFTFHGTGTYIIGEGRVAVIDPGPALAAHVDALLAALDGETISHMVVTHTHIDHSPACDLLHAHTDAPTYGYGPHGQGKIEAGVVVEEGGDMAFAPDVVIREGDVIEGADWRLECVFTPGHTSNHMCFAHPQSQSLFCGDHVMAWSTTVVSPPDGDMHDYVNSLNKLLQRDDRTYWPTHGPNIQQPQAFVRDYIAHRHEREVQIMNLLGEGHHQIAAMVPVAYPGLDPRLIPAAGRSMLATLLALADQGRVQIEGEPGVDAQFYLTKL